MRQAWKRLLAPLLLMVACAMGCSTDEEVTGVPRPGKTASAAPESTPSPTPSTVPTSTPTPTPTPEPTAIPTPYVAPTVAVNPTPPGGIPTEAPATFSIPN